MVLNFWIFWILDSAFFFLKLTCWTCSWNSDFATDCLQLSQYVFILKQVNWCIVNALCGIFLLQLSHNWVSTSLCESPSFNVPLVFPFPIIVSFFFGVAVVGKLVGVAVTVVNEVVSTIGGAKSVNISLSTIETALPGLTSRTSNRYVWFKCVTEMVSLKFEKKKSNLEKKKISKIQYHFKN